MNETHQLLNTFLAGNVKIFFTFDYIKRNQRLKTFANLPFFRCIHEGLFRLYNSWA